MTAPNEFVELARIMQNFFDAVKSRCDVRVEEAVVQLDALHGENAAIEAMVQACDAMRNGEDEDCRFWMSVFHQLIAPDAAGGSRVTFH
jgi:hypothetical protein